HDITAPTPDVSNLPTVTVECSATTPAPTATDDYSGAIPRSTSDPLTYNTQGTYTITWTYDDGNGNTSTQTQTVIVVDTTAPTITLNGANPQTIEACGTYNELGASANDPCFGDITASIVIDASAVNTVVVGSYNVTYNVTDANG